MKQQSVSVTYAQKSYDSATCSGENHKIPSSNILSSHITAVEKLQFTLPSTNEEWNMLNDYFKAALVLAVMSFEDFNSKFFVLVDGTYSYNGISDYFSTKQQSAK